MPGLEDAGLENPTANEILIHPDGRQAATFFLGAVFLLTLQFLWRGRLLAPIRIPIRRVIRTRIRQKNADLEKGHGRTGSAGTVLFDEKALQDEIVNTEIKRLEPTRSDDPRNFVFFLNLTTSIACVSYVGSLMTFNPSAEAACSAAIVFGGLAAQAIRLLGLYKLSYVLKDLGVNRWETRIFIGGIFLAAVMMIVTNAISAGALRQIAALPGIAFCYRKHFAPTNVVLGLLNIFLEFYTIMRVIVLTFPRSPKLQHPFNVLLDIRIGWGASLLLLDVLTLTPSAVAISVAADYIPFALSALFVLWAFNHRTEGPPEPANGRRIPILLDDPVDDDASMITVTTDGTTIKRKSAKPAPIVVPPPAVAHLRDPDLQTASWATPTRGGPPTQAQMLNLGGRQGGAQPSPSTLVPFSFRQSHRHTRSVGVAEGKRFFPDQAPNQSHLPSPPESQSVSELPYTNAPLPPPPPPPVHYDNTLQRYGADAAAGPLRPRADTGPATATSPMTAVTPVAITPKASRPRISVHIPGRIARHPNSAATPPAATGPSKPFSHVETIQEYEQSKAHKRMSSRDLTPQPPLHRDSLASISTLSSEFPHYAREDDSPPEFDGGRYPSEKGGIPPPPVPSIPSGLATAPAPPYRAPSPAIPAARAEIHHVPSNPQVANPFLSAVEEQNMQSAPWRLPPAGEAAPSHRSD